jgi:hypothetical protein
MAKVTKSIRFVKAGARITKQNLEHTGILGIENDWQTEADL